MWVEQDTYRRYTNERLKRTYRENKAHGQCAYCGKYPPLPPFVACEECRKFHRRYSLLWRRRQREMRRQGLLHEPDHAAD